MATTIKVDTVLATFTWQDDQTLDPAADVDYFVPAANTPGNYVPQSEVGKGSDEIVAEPGKAITSKPAE